MNNVKTVQFKYSNLDRIFILRFMYNKTGGRLWTELKFIIHELFHCISNYYYQQDCTKTIFIPESSRNGFNQKLFQY